MDGSVIGETVSRTPEGIEEVRRFEYLRITPTGMTVGFMNGMRPRGVVLFEGTLKEDTLEGTTRFGGIDFRRPDGTKPPPLHFSFKRVGK